MSQPDLSLGDLSHSALTALLEYFDVVRALPPQGRPARAWGEIWVWLISAEIAQRNNTRLVARRPMIVEMCDLDVAELVVFTADLNRLACTNREGLERWCTDAVLALCVEQDRRRTERQQERDELAARLAELRVQRSREPYTNPEGDIFPPWSVISSRPPDDSV